MLFLFFSWHSELRYSKACEIASYTICSFAFPQSNKCVQQLVFQVNPTHALIVIQHQNGFDYFFASNCNSSGVMTAIRRNHSDNFLSLYFVTDTGPECYYFTFFFSFMSFTFFGTFSRFSFSVLTMSCVQSLVFWLDMVSYRNYASTQSDPVSIEALPVQEQWLLFCWCQL
jgi:hypothetical protein